MKQITLTMSLEDDTAFMVVYKAFLHKTVRERTLGLTADFIEMNATLYDISSARRAFLCEVPAHDVLKKKLLEHNQFVMKRSK